jgi:hypothetical protein
MTQRELLKRVVEVLEGAGVSYALVGSFAAGVYSDARSTHDVDLVVQLTTEGQAALLREFRDPDFHLDEYAIRDAVRRCDMFNMLDETSGDKVDFWLLKTDPYEQQSFRRRRRLAALGMELFVLSPEDVILSKLRWSKIGGSERQVEDAANVYEVQRAVLDMEYLLHWARVLEVEAELKQVEEQAEPPV